MRNKQAKEEKEKYEFDEKTSDSSEINVKRQYKIQKIRRNPRQLDD